MQSNIAGIFSIYLSRKQSIPNLTSPFFLHCPEHHAAAADDAEGEGADPELGEPSGSGVASNIPPFGLPTSLVKKIAGMDPEFQRISGEGNKAMAKATALFLEWLAIKSLAHATANKRKNFKFADIEAVAKKDRRLTDMDLPTYFQEDAVFAEIHERLDEENQARQAKRKPNADATGEELARQKLRPLTDFFAANTQG